MRTTQDGTSGKSGVDMDAPSAGRYAMVKHNLYTPDAGVKTLAIL
jgi:hypothetical protein